jgi:ribonuclease-3
MEALSIAAFQELSNLHFNDQSLLLRGLTHPSFLNEHPDQATEDNQRLEFLGDAVIDFVSGEMLYHRFPEASEGRLTRLRAALVRTQTLAELAIQTHINEALLLGRGEEESGGRSRVGNLCAAFEAVIGALYLDQGFQAVRDFVCPLFEAALEEILRLELDKDPKSMLQEYCQAKLGITPIYQTVSSQGPDHAKEFTVVVIIGERRYAEGKGFSKQAAAQMAAKQALAILQAEYGQP